MKELEGKKLLIIGASNYDVDVVKIAQSIGCYVIVTDNRTGKDCPAKPIADEAWDISWMDYDTLEKKCRDSGINGIMAGVSEFRIEAMIEMCERLGLPCYINRDQLEITRDKNKFKNLCKKYGVPIVNEYDPNDANIQFPVIIKPTDRGGSIGINVAYNAEEYKKYLAYAYEMSPSKSVVVEDYIGDGVKFDCTYYINGKQAILIETCDTTMLGSQKGFETKQKAWTFPSRFEKEYIDSVDGNVKAMLSDMGMECGVANISFFYRNGQFYVFETGFRLGGGHSFDYHRASDGIDYLTMMIKYGMGVPFIVKPNFILDRGYSITYSPYFMAEQGSVVEKILGEEEVLKLKETITYLPIIYDEYVVEDDKPQKITMISLYSEDLDTLVKKVDFINKTIKVKTNKGICPVYGELTEKDILTALKPN
jgi:biotin carboxylase